MEFHIAQKEVEPQQNVSLCDLCQFESDCGI
jgi:hypothetical protein